MLVFTGDRVAVGLMGSAGPCDLAKVKSTESEAD